MNKNKFIFACGLLAFSLAACDSSKPEEPKKPAPVRDTVDVFVLSGQSNMEGSTLYYRPQSPEGQKDLLKNYLDERGVDSEAIFGDGLTNVVTSYYGYYYPNGIKGAHTNCANIKNSDGSLKDPTKDHDIGITFEPTKVGMGVGDSYQGQTGLFFGPELGIAQTLSEYASDDYPVHLVKCAFSGSGFTKTDGANWTNMDEDSSKSLYYILKTYTQLALDAIEEEGFTPVLRGFVWHQGESDSGDNQYDVKMKTLLNTFKEDFKSYAIDEDPDNIAFLDCTISDAGLYGANPGCNARKLAMANESEDDLMFCINGSTKDPDGLNLQIGDDSKGGYNTYHYNTESGYRLGEAYGKIIIDNDLIEY